MSSAPSTAHRRDFCRALYLQPSNNKTVRIVQSFCNLLTAKRIYLCYEFIWVHMSFYEFLWVQMFLLQILLSPLEPIWLPEEFALNTSFCPFLPFDTLLRKLPLFFIRYTKSIYSIVRTLEALCKKMRKKERCYAKIVDKRVCFSAKNRIFAC